MSIKSTDLTIKAIDKLSISVIIRVLTAIGKGVIDGNEYDVTDGDAVVVPAGAQHNVVNVSDSEELKLYTIYSPAHHQDGVVRKTKTEAEADSPEFDGKTSE